jgi:hypothetical protein
VAVRGVAQEQGGWGAVAEEVQEVGRSLVESVRGGPARMQVVGMEEELRWRGRDGLG